MKKKLSHNNIREISVIRKKVNKLEKQNQEYLEGWKRAKADFINVKKRHEQEQREFGLYANKNLILELLPVLDNFTRAFNDIPEKEQKVSWIQGMKFIQDRFRSVLKDQGVTEMKLLGEVFNPELHEAVETVAQKEKSKDHNERIVEIIEQGYLLHGKVLRPAKVKITS